jgi:hypothetical protein
VWGVPCAAISAEWGAQRVKGLDVKKVIAHELRRRLGRPETSVETSLVERFLYPRLGPGQMWEEATRRIEARGGEVLIGQAVVGLETETVASPPSCHAISRRAGSAGTRPRSCSARRRSRSWCGCSTRGHRAPSKRSPEGLQYRDFITVGLDVERLRLGEGRSVGRIKDNWIYVHEPSVKVGRIQIFNNWSPAMVADPERTWVGLEYFCARGDELWRKDDAAMIAFAERELVSLGAIRSGEARNGIVLRVPRTYPRTSGPTRSSGRCARGSSSSETSGSSVERDAPLQQPGPLDAHRHDAVDNIVAGRNERENVWAINTEDEYLETRR